MGGRCHHRLMKVAVLGVGAIGGWLAGALAQAGAEVSLMARGATLEALKREGLRVSQNGAERRFDLQAGSATELGLQDIVIVALKAQALPAAVNDLAALLAPHTTVVSAMNGIPWWFFQGFAGPLENVSLDSVDPGGRIASLVTARRALGCVVHASAKTMAPGQVQVGAVDRLIFGAPSGAQHDTLHWLVEIFSRAGIRSEASAHIRMEVWAKLWGNMNMGPLSALTRATTGRMLDDADIHALCVRMMEEMAECGRRLGLSFAMQAAERMAVTRKLGDFKTSMLQDLENGRPLEFEPLLGAVVEIARRLQAPAPFCESVLGLVRQLSHSLSQS